MMNDRLALARPGALDEPVAPDEPLLHVLADGAITHFGRPKPDRGRIW
jgi:hypothetical protein